jgi:sugar O-acyltransferase (sialic acid O-acetyltransferase NeuD family)
MKKLIIFGAGGFGKEVYHEAKMPYIERDISFMVDDEYYNNQENTIRFSDFDKQKHSIVVAVGDPILRSNIVNKFPKGTRFETIISRFAIITDPNIKIGEGSIICAGAVITPNVRIGNHCQIQANSTIGHDVELGHFTTISPSSTISGNVETGECVFVGANASIKEKLFIAGYTTIGMGAAVIKDIMKYGTYVGVPAKMIEK